MKSQQKRLELVTRPVQFKDPKLFETLVLTMGTLSRKTTHTKLSSTIMQLLISGLQECKSQACILVHLRGLRNTQVWPLTQLFPGFPFLQKMIDLPGGKITPQDILLFCSFRQLNVSQYQTLKCRFELTRLSKALNVALCVAPETRTPSCVPPKAQGTEDLLKP